MVKRVYFHCEKLEEAPMWGNAPPSESDLLIEKSYDLLRESDAFEIACNQVFEEWPNSSEQNLSARCMNRCAWIGWAACCVAHSSTEYTTRNAWRLLTKEEQEQANAVANKVIKEYENAKNWT